MDLNPRRRMLHCFEFVRIKVTILACRSPLPDQNAIRVLKQPLQRLAVFCRVWDRVLSWKVWQRELLVTFHETCVSMPETLTPEVFGRIPPQHRFCPTGFCRLFYAKCLMFVCRNLQVVINSESDYSEINDNVFVCSCIHSSHLNMCWINCRCLLCQTAVRHISSMQIAQC